MQKKKIIKIVLIVPLVVIVAVAGFGYNFINSLLYPDVLISGSGEKKWLQ